MNNSETQGIKNPGEGNMLLKLLNQLISRADCFQFLIGSNHVLMVKWGQFNYRIWLKF